MRVQGAKIYLGCVVGAIIGLFIYVLASLFLHPSLNFSPGTNLTQEIFFQSLNQIVFAFSSVQLLAIILGAVAGLIIVYNSRRIALYSTTIFLGALSGLMVYVVGFLVTNYPNMVASELYVRSLEAVYSFAPAEFLSIFMGGFIGFFIAKNLWKFTGLLMYVSLLSIIFGYLVYSFTVTLPVVAPAYRALSITLFVAETASLLMVAVYAFYALDVYVKTGWRRTPSKIPFSKYYTPKVAFHVPIYNEPAEIVEATLKSLLKMDYPKDRFEIMVIDDSTLEESWKPIKKLCQQYKMTYLRREDRKGYKAGALNYALKRTSDDTDLVAIVDADYQVEPDYLKEVVGYFINPNLGFIQTPQDYRNKYENYLTEQYYYADSYFYRAVLPSRNEANAIIFAGTMGIIRKDVVEEIGLWGESFISEDAEISVRILNAGYESLYINRTFGRGLIPNSFEGYKKQLYRWSFGGVKILKAHFTKFIFSRKMTWRQKFDFLMGGIHWFDGIWILIIAAVITTLALGDLFGFPVVTYHQREVWLIGLVPIFLMADGLMRLHMALRRSMGLSLFGTFRVMGMWFSIKFNNMFAAFMSLFGVSTPFVRTPKRPAEKITFLEAIDRSISLTKFETAWFLLLIGLATVYTAKTLILFGLSGTMNYTRLLLAFWLLFYSIIFICAPLYAYKSYMSPSTHSTQGGITMGSFHALFRGIKTRKSQASEVNVNG